MFGVWRKLVSFGFPTKIEMKEEIKKVKKEPFWKNINIYLGLVLILIIFAIFSPIIFTSTSSSTIFDFTETGEIGDTIGGIMNPFVAIAGVIVTYLAFKMQFDANKRLKDEIAKQQLERQFYEMLRLYKENVNEVSINLYKKGDQKQNITVSGSFTSRINFEHELDETYKGRKVFSTYLEEIKTVYYYILINYIGPEKQTFKNFKETLKQSYQIFFNGLQNFTYSIDEAKNEKFQNILRINTDNEIVKRTNGLNRKLFIGQSNYLGHYFRHLYHTVKFIASNNLLEEPEKIKYLKILRSQISNEEQVLLFYNYVGSYGRKWENKDQKYFSQYKMIHNIDNSMLIDGFKLEDFFGEQMKIHKDMFDFQL